MKSIVQASLVLSAVVLLACQKIKLPDVHHSPASPLSINSVLPAKVATGKEVLLFIEYSPDNPFETNQLLSINANDNTQNSGIAVYIGDEKAEILSVSNNLVMIRVSSLVNPGFHYVALSINGYSTVSENPIEVVKSDLSSTE